jgi:glycosyltransferase involved in cell wall biosynthesis
MTTATSIASHAAVPSGAGGRSISRVALATINRTEGDTGVHTHAKMLSEGLRDAGVTCDIVSAFSASRAWMPVFALRPLMLHHLNKTWSTLWHRRWHMAALRQALQRYVAQHRPDVVLAQCPVSAKAALEVRAATRGEFAIAMVCHFNHSEAAEYREKGELRGRRNYHAMLEFEDRVLEAVDRVIYVSEWAKQSVEQARGLHTRSSSVIWNGLADGPATTPLSRAGFGLRDDDIVLINVGSLEPRKNQIALLPLFAEINAKHPSTRLILIGDGPHRGEIERKVAQLELKNAVKLLGHRRDVPLILPLADLYVHYATLENCPLALIEAARAGLPFAAVPAGGVSELQSALGCRIDLTPHDVQRSLENLRPLLADAAFRRQQGQQARERFVATFTRKAMTEAYLQALAAI